MATTEYAGLTAYTGGIGRHYAALLPALVRQGVEIDLLLLPDGEQSATSLDDGVTLLAAPRTERMPDAVATAVRRRRVAQAFSARSYDAVFAPEWQGLAASLPRTAPLLTNLATGARLANEVSGLTLRDLPLSRRGPVARQMARERRQVHRSRGVVAISNAMLDRCRELFPELPPARVVRNCIDVDAVRRGGSVASTPAGWPGDGPIVLFLGRSERRKGVVDAVTAFARVHAQRPDARLVLAGAGGDARFEPTRAALLHSLPASARDRVTWLGHVSGDDLYGAIRRSAVVMCASRWEGFGNVALEVKAIGTPLVVTTGSGFDDFCTDGEDAQMVPPADPERLAAAVTLALRHPSWARSLAERARREVGRFAPDPVAADLLDAAGALLGTAHTAS